MALMRIDFISQSLMRTVTVNAVIPTDKIIPGQEPPKGKKFKALFLLHGIFGNYTDWVTKTRIQTWAEDMNLAVIMPSGENKFYVDNPKTGDLFGKFVGEELVEFCRRTLPISDKREDTFIGGLSMGGFGALRNGLKYNETFGNIVALSSGLLKEEILRSEYKKDGSIIGNRYYYEGIMGRPAEEFSGSDMDYEALIENLVRENKRIPDIYMACGTEDTLFKANVDFHRFLDEKGVKHTFVEGPGAHDWVFWDTYIRKSLDWLPLEGETKGISSGHVN